MSIMLIQCPLDKTSNKQELHRECNWWYNTCTYFPQTLQDYNPVGLSWINFYETLFKKSSSRSILQELVRLTKISVRRKNEIIAVGSIGEKAAMKLPGILLQMFAKKINLKYRKIEAALTSNQDLQKLTKELPLDSLRNEGELCINGKYCMQSIGEI